VKRFLKTLALLIISLFLVASGVNTALDRMAQLPREASFTIYNSGGLPILAYNGDLNQLKVCTRPALPTTGILHRS
jgi:hypothetical protein